MATFGLNDEVIEQFGLDDEQVGQAAVTKPAIRGGQAALAPPKTTRPVYTAGGVTQTPIDQSSPAAQAGVDVDTGAGMGTRAGLGFAPNDDYKLQYLAARLQQAYKQPVQVRIGPQSKEPEFFSPKTQKWTTANGSGLVSGAVDAVAGLAGTVGGMALGGLTGTPVGVGAGAVGGAGVGSAVGQGINNSIAKGIGAVDKDYPIGSDVGSAGATGAAIEAVPLIGLGAIKYARYWFKGAKAFGAKEAAELGAEAAKADKLIEEIQSTSGMPFNPTVGQRVASGMESTELGQKALGYDAALEKDPTTAHKTRALFGANEDALVGYFEGATTPLARRTADGAYELSKEDATKGVAQGLTSGYDSLMSTARELVSKLPDTLPASESGSIMRGALVKADRAFKSEIEDPAWSKYRDGTGYNPKTFASDIHVPINEDLRTLMSTWDARSRNAIIKAIKSDNSELKLLGKDKDSFVAEFEWDKDGMPSLKSFKDGNSVDLTTLDDTIKWLRSDARDALKNQAGVTYSDKDLVAMERSLTHMRNDYLKDSKPELYDLLQQAEAATKLRASQFRQSAIGDLLVKDGPDSYRLSDVDAVYRLINAKDDTAAKQFMDLTKGYPEAKQQAQQMLYALYRKAVINPLTGAPSPKAHARFMRDYGNVTRQFFREEEPEILNRLGGMGTLIAQQEQQLKKVLPQVQKTLGGEFSSLNSVALAKNVLSDTMSPEKIRLTAKILRNNGQDDLVEEWKSSVLDQLGKNLIKDGQINSSALSKLLNGPQKETLRSLLNSGTLGTGFKNGDSYIKNLETLQEGLNMIRVQGKGAVESQSRGMMVRLARLFFGPFSAEGRTVTFGQGSRTRAVPGEIYKAITDQNELAKLAKSVDKTMGQVKKASYLGALGNIISDANY